MSVQRIHDQQYRPQAGDGMSYDGTEYYKAHTLMGYAFFRGMTASFDSSHTSIFDCPYGGFQYQFAWQKGVEFVQLRRHLDAMSLLLRSESQQRQKIAAGFQAIAGKLASEMKNIFGPMFTEHRGAREAMLYAAATVDPSPGAELLMKMIRPAAVCRQAEQEITREREQAKAAEDSWGNDDK